MPNTDVKLTYEDYRLFPDDGLRHELIDGEHYVTAAPVTRHQAILWALARWIDRAIEGAPGRAFFAPFEVKLSEVDVVQPDLVYIGKQRLHHLGEAGLHGPPDLVVEILSASTRRRDRTLKAKLYEKHEVGEYWLIDPEQDTIELWRLQERRYQLVAKGGRGERLGSPLFPERELVVDEVLGYPPVLG